jgi:dual specificity MAP kinase phosphatase
MGRLSLYKVDTDDVAAALDHLARQPMPDPAQVFPWLHGLHPGNGIQQAFFMARKRALRKTPPCLRGITLVKADGELNVARLKGAIAPHEFLQRGGPVAEFLDVDPKDGFSVRNFQIQAAKSAMTSDIIIYGDDDVAVRKLGWDVAAAQQRWRDKHEAQRHHLPWYNTFVCVSPFSEFEEKHPEIVSVNSAGLLTGNVLDFFHQERREMYEMTQASEFSHNVWLGPTPDSGSEEEQSYDVLIECSDLGRLNPAALQAISELADDETKQYHLDFPSSGSILPPTWSHAEADGILETCKWLYHLSHGTRPPPPTEPTEQPSPDPDTDGDSDTPMTTATPPPTIRPRKILLHCNDGYTESTMLAVAYHSYASGLPAPTAWLDLHTTHHRNIFAYPSDVGLLSALAPRLLQSSPATTNPHNIPLSDLTTMLQQHEPRWFAGFDGSFPSRVLEYMYLGNLGHANNPDLLRALGIGQILSVGEQAMWRDGELEEWGVENVCLVKGVQDNGIDSLMDEFERCLEFVGECFSLFPLALLFSLLLPPLLLFSHLHPLSSPYSRPSLYSSSPFPHSYSPLPPYTLLSPCHPPSPLPPPSLPPQPIPQNKPKQNNKLTKDKQKRPRPPPRNRNPSTLPRRRLPQRHHLHRRSHAQHGALLPARLLFRARAPAECDYPAAFAVCV